MHASGGSAVDRAHPKRDLHGRPARLRQARGRPLPRAARRLARDAAARTTPGPRRCAHELERIGRADGEDPHRCPRRRARGFAAEAEQAAEPSVAAKEAERYATDTALRGRRARRARPDRGRRVRRRDARRGRGPRGPGPQRRPTPRLAETREQAEQLAEDDVGARRAPAPRAGGRRSTGWRSGGPPCSRRWTGSRASCPARRPSIARRTSRTSSPRSPRAPTSTTCTGPRTRTSTTSRPGAGRVRGRGLRRRGRDGRRRGQRARVRRGRARGLGARRAPACAPERGAT